MKQSFKAIITTLMMTISSWSFEVVGFFPDYGSGFGFQLEHIESLSQLNFFTAVPAYNGTMTLPATLNPNDGGVWAEIAIVRGTRAVLTIGGNNNSGGFASATSRVYRANFIQNIVKLVDDFQFTGVDIDWEFPSSTSEQNNYATFLAQLKTALPAGSTMSVDVPATGYNGKYFPVSLFTNVDYVNIMAYDDWVESGWDQNHSSYDKMVNHVNYWVNKGVPKSKIIVGVPFYGLKNWSSTIKYSEILTANPDILPSVDVWDGHYFNGYDLIKKKTQYVKDEGYAGIMIWEVSQDEIYHEYSRLKAINEVVTPQYHDDVIPVSSSSVVSSSSEVAVSSSGEFSSSSESASAVDFYELELGIKVLVINKNYLQLSHSNGQNIQVKLTNSLGVQVQSTRSNTELTQWSQELKQGIYFLEIYAEGAISSMSQKLLVR